MCITDTFGDENSSCTEKSIVPVQKEGNTKEIDNLKYYIFADYHTICCDLFLETVNFRLQCPLPSLPFPLYTPQP